MIWALTENCAADHNYHLLFYLLCTLLVSCDALTVENSLFFLLSVGRITCVSRVIATNDL